MLSPLKLAVALCAVGATAVDFTCWKGRGHTGPITGVYKLTDSWQNAADCGSGKWTTRNGNHNCIWIRGSKGMKSWSAGSKDPPHDIFKDIGFNSQIREFRC